MDLVVTVPKWFWPEWIAEGDAAGEPQSGIEWGFFVGHDRRPPIEPGERLYIVAQDRLRGYAPVVRVEYEEERGYGIVRRGGAVAMTIPWEPIDQRKLTQPRQIKGFRGYRKVWWDRGIEIPFPDWKIENVRLK